MLEEYMQWRMNGGLQHLEISEEVKYEDCWIKVNVAEIFK